MGKDILTRFLSRKLKDNYHSTIGENIASLEGSQDVGGSLYKTAILVKNLDSVFFDLGNQDSVLGYNKLRKNFPGLEGKFKLGLDKERMTTEQLQSRYDQLDVALKDRYTSDTDNNTEAAYVKYASKVILSHVEYKLFLGNQKEYGLSDEYKKAMLVKYLESARDMLAFEKSVREPGLLQKLDVAMINYQFKGYRRPSLEVGENDENIARLNGRAADFVAKLYQIPKS